MTNVFFDFIRSPQIGKMWPVIPPAAGISASGNDLGIAVAASHYISHH
jgi:hypothetical protein